MHNSAHDEYLVTQVMTATPQKLHLMLIEAALRQCELARQGWQDSQEEAASAALSKAQEILTELLACLNFVDQPQFARRFAGIYTFIFRSLVKAQVHREENSRVEAVRLLEIERETWRHIVQKTGGDSIAAMRAAHLLHAVPAPVRMTDIATSSFSFEA